MNPTSHTSEDLEISIEEFDSAELPSLDDLMREFVDDDRSAAPVAPALIVKSNFAPANQTTAHAQPAANAARGGSSQSDGEKQELVHALERVTADFEKYRWRAERERSEHYSFAVVGIVRDLLPILDNFERAIASANYSLEEASFSQFVGGVELIYQQTIKFLADLGVNPIPAMGALFDPRVHEAIATEPRADVAANTVIEEIMRGYRMGEKLIRPAMVKVSTKDEG